MAPPPQQADLAMQTFRGLLDNLHGNLKALLDYHETENGRWPIPEGLTKDDFEEGQLRGLKFDHLSRLFGDAGAINVHVELHGTLPPEVRRERRKYEALSDLSAEARSVFSYLD